MANQETKPAAEAPPENTKAGTEAASAEAPRPQLTATELYRREQQAASRRWAESEKRRDEQARIRRQYAMFYWLRNLDLEQPINLGDSGGGMRSGKPWTWMFVSDLELSTLRNEQKRRNIGLVVLPEKMDPTKLAVDKAAAASKQQASVEPKTTGKG